MTKKGFTPHHFERNKCQKTRASSVEKNKFQNGAGFTLVEMLVYIAALSVVILAVSYFFLWTVRSNTKTKVMRETLDNARRAMEVMTYEIREAKSIYSPTSNADQVSLETTNHLPTGEETTYIDFYLCGDQLCFKKESPDSITPAPPIALTSERVQVSNLVFSQIISGEAPSIQIDLRVNFNDTTSRPEYQVEVNLKSTVSLRDN